MAMSSPTSGSAWRRERDRRGAWTLWFDQPGRSLNVLDRPAVDELGSHLAEVRTDPSIPALLIRSAKPGGFCAGADLRTVLACRTASEVQDLLARGLDVLDQLAQLTVPTIAVIHGVCLGGGLELALACRWRVALASAAPLQVGLPEVHLGLIPAWGGLTRLPRLIGPEDAIELLVTGRALGYLRARSLGIVDRLASEGDREAALDFSGSVRQERTFARETWEGALDRMRTRLEGQPGEHPDAQELILSLLATDLGEHPEAARDAAIKAFAELAVSEEVRESIAAFFRRGGVVRPGAEGE
jgi:3-hydroxyacyl-CoA dehydrogenase/enoyl-CoA hydratase/3-hydroxybutyryl-CoA epimerase